MWSLWRLFNLKVTHILCAVSNTIAQSIPCSLPLVANYEATFILDLCFQFGKLACEREDFSSGSMPPREGKRERIKEGLRF